MKRHTTEAPRYGHHERASIAARIGRAMRRVVKPARLYWLAMQERSADEHMADLAALHEMSISWMQQQQRKSTELKAKRMAIERGVA